MKCDFCENEATVHETTNRHGVKVERHLCQQCAAQQGLAPAGPVPGIELVTKLIAPGTTQITIGPVPQPARGAVCPSCKLTFAEFKLTGLLGCPECYRVFESAIAPMIERAHEGASAHEGKCPVRLRGAGRLAGQEAQPAGVQDVSGRIAALRGELSDAVRCEQYEKAARLRDELRRLGDAGPGKGQEPA